MYLSSLIASIAGIFIGLFATCAIPHSSVGLHSHLVNISAPGCNANDCLRALRNPTVTAAASSFCSAYNHIVPMIITSTRTITFYLNESIQPYTTVEVTTYESKILAPAALPGATSIQFTLPAYLSMCQYEPSRISSACSCFVTPDTIVVSATEIEDILTVVELPTMTLTRTTTITGPHIHGPMSQESGSFISWNGA